MPNNKRKEYRPELPPLPANLKALPVERGYPVPWFVAKVGDTYDFRVIGPGKIATAVKLKLCWICGQPLGHEFTFPIGPMCAITRTTSEPPSHHRCADWSARACPFLTQKETRRRQTGLPQNVREAPGIPNDRQPGVIALWRTDSYTRFNDGHNRTLFTVGPPLQIHWLRQGRPATRPEVMQSITSGYPALKELANQDQDPEAANADLQKTYERFLTILPT